MTTTADDGDDFVDDSTTESEDSSSDYKGRQAAEEEGLHETDGVAICEAVAKPKRDFRGMKPPPQKKDAATPRGQSLRWPERCWEVFCRALHR